MSVLTGRPARVYLGHAQPRDARSSSSRAAPPAPAAAPPTPLQREIAGSRARWRRRTPISSTTCRARASAPRRRSSRRRAGAEPAQLVVGLMRLSALPGPRDGHTAIYPLRRAPEAAPRLSDPALRLRRRPARRRLARRRRPDREAADRDRGTAGRRGRRARPTARAARQRVEPALAAARVPRRRAPRCCAGSGSRGADAVAFGFAGGEEVTLEPQPAHEVASSVGSALAPLPARGNPVWLRNLDEDQWLTTIASGRVVYLGYRATTGATDDSRSGCCGWRAAGDPPRRRRRPPQPRRQQPDLRAAPRRALAAGDQPQARAPDRPQTSPRRGTSRPTCPADEARPATSSRESLADERDRRRARAAPRASGATRDGRPAARAA